MSNARDRYLYCSIRPNNASGWYSEKSIAMVKIPFNLLDNGAVVKVWTDNNHVAYLSDRGTIPIKHRAISINSCDLNICKRNVSMGTIKLIFNKHDPPSHITVDLYLKYDIYRFEYKGYIEMKDYVIYLDRIDYNDPDSDRRRRNRNRSRSPVRSRTFSPSIQPSQVMEPIQVIEPIQSQAPQVIESIQSIQSQAPQAPHTLQVMGPIQESQPIRSSDPIIRPDVIDLITQVTDVYKKFHIGLATIEMEANLTNRPLNDHEKNAISFTANLFAKHAT